LTNLDLANYIYLRLLLSIDGIGPGKILTLLNHFESPQSIFSSDFNSLVRVDKISNTLANRILTAHRSITTIKEIVEQELEKLEKLSAKVITYWDVEYPLLLKKIYFPPLILYTLGEFSEMDNYSLAIVGTRQPTNYGRSQTEKFASEFAKQNIVVVSGMARGIDSIAHKSALKNGGRTIAVIGSGLDVIYPPENKKLYAEIMDSGLVISEYELGTKPDAQNFPKRNRIISGLTQGTLVIETGLNGGAMQTASYALDQNREIFALPGYIGVKQSEGTNKLIQKGEAKLVTAPEDVLVELEFKLKPVIGQNIPKPTIELNIFEEKIINSLGTEAVHIDMIADNCSMNTAECLVHLLSLEFKGAIKQLPGKMFAVV